MKEICIAASINIGHLGVDARKVLHWGRSVAATVRRDISGIGIGIGVGGGWWVIS